MQRRIQDPQFMQMLQKQFKFRTVKEMHALNYNSFTLTVAIIGVGIYSIEAGGYNLFDSHARDMYHNSHSEGKGHVYCWKYHPCINQYNIFRLYIGMRIYMNLKVYILPPLNLIFSQAMLNIIVYQMLIVTNVPVNSAALQFYNILLIQNSGMICLTDSFIRQRCKKRSTFKKTV